MQNIDIKPNLTNKHLLYKRTKYLFNVTKFIPGEKLPFDDVPQRQNSVSEDRLGTLYEAFRKVTTLHILPIQVAHCKLTKDQIKTIKEEMLKYTVSDEEVEDFISKETEKDRLTRMWSKNHLGERTYEYSVVMGTTLKSAVITYIGLFFMKHAQNKKQFIRENQGAQYFSRFMAGRRIRDRILADSKRFAAVWAFKISFLIWTTLAVSQSIAVYRNRSSVIEYVIGTGLGCSMTRFMHGPEGMFAGFIFGSIFGLVIGGAALVVMKATNNTQQERHVEQVRALLRYQKKVRGELTEKKVTPKLDAEW